VNWLRSRLPNGANQLRSHDRRVRVPFLLPKGAENYRRPYFFAVQLSIQHSPIADLEHPFALRLSQYPYLSISLTLPRFDVHHSMQSIGPRRRWES
jgi:hypothetical protein